MRHSLKTTKKQLRKARKLTNDQLCGMVFSEMLNCPETVAWMHEIRERLKDSCAVGDKRDPRA